MAKYASYILFLLISILVAALYINNFGPLAAMQSSINDKLLSLTASNEPVSNVVVVAIDGRASDQYGQWPWDYDLIADLTAALASGEPNVIVLDFEIREDAQQEASGHTKILAEQLSWINNVVLPYDIALATFRNNKTGNPDHLFDYSLAINNKLGLMDEESSLQVRKVFLPAGKVLETEPFLGFSYAMPDDDRILRHQALAMNYEGYYYPSVALMAATVFLGVPPDMVQVFEGSEIRIGNEETIPINSRSEFFINFYRDNPFKRFSASEILGEGFNFSRLKGKAILVTVDDFSYTEAFQTPVNKETPKHLITASVISNIINRDVVTVGFNSAVLNLLVLLLLGGLCAFIMPQISTLYRFVTLGIGLFILVNINYFMLSSFKVIVELVYFGLEFVLFMAAAPLLESSLVLGEQANELRKKREKEKLKNRAEKESRKDKGASQEPRVREIVSSITDPENIDTVAVAKDKKDALSKTKIEKPADLVEPGTAAFTDHQAINLDDEPPKSERKRAPLIARIEKIDAKPDLSDTPAPGDEPEIIKPVDIDDDADLEPASVAGDDEDIMGASDSDLNFTPIPTDIKNLGRYQIDGILGKGAMGQVYKGVDPVINRPVALKTIRLDFLSDPSEMAELKERLHREAHAAGKLSHPNIVTIYDVGSEGDLQYIAMEYLAGRTLESMIKKRTKFNYRIIAQIIVQICAALDYAHQQGIVHRDIKPANIMILSDYRVKVMDYGIARIDSTSMTKTGIAMGTPNYISPEQLKGQQVDHRADLFSLGVVMYELLLGKRPFKGENITSLIYSIIHKEPEKPSNVSPQIPLLFDHIVGRALKKDPKERYQRATEIVSDLSDFVESFAVRNR